MHNMIKLRDDFVEEGRKLAEDKFGSVHGLSTAVKALGIKAPTTPSRIFGDNIARRTDPQRMELGTFLAFVRATNTSIDYWLQGVISTKAGRDLWGKIIVAHGEINPEESDLVNHLLVIMRNGDRDQRTGMSSHLANLCNYIAKMAKKGPRRILAQKALTVPKDGRTGGRKPKAQKKKRTSDGPAGRRILLD